MRKRTLLNEIEKLNKENEELRNELTLAKASTTREYNEAIIKLDVANETISELESKLKVTTSMRDKWFNELTTCNEQLIYMQHAMNAVRVLSQADMNFIVKYRDVKTTVEIYVHDAAGNDVVVKLCKDHWNIESEDGLDGMMIPGKWEVSCADIILKDAEGNEDYAVTFSRNVVEKLR